MNSERRRGNDFVALLRKAVLGRYSLQDQLFVHNPRPRLLVHPGGGHGLGPLRLTQGRELRGKRSWGATVMPSITVFVGTTGLIFLGLNFYFHVRRLSGSQNAFKPVRAGHLLRVCGRCVGLDVCLGGCSARI